MNRGLLEELLAGDAELHGWDASVVFDWHLDVDAVRFIFDRVQPGWRTLETGCGYSTIAFALAGADHTAVSPFPEEHRRIQRWCEEREIDLANVHMLPARSQQVLPSLGDPDEDPLDVLLIDGDHSFPVPFIDWYYGADRLRPGGLLIVDDLHIRTGGILNEHLASDSGRWRPCRRFPTTIVYERLDAPLLPKEGWVVQPFTKRPLWKPLARRWVLGVRRDGVVPRLRSSLRIRSRLRAAVARRGA